MILKLAQGMYSFSLVIFTYISAKYFTDIGVDSFYETLNTSQATPENNYFTYIWKILYTLLFLSFYIVLSSKKSIEQYEDANVLFICQLFLQVLWCFSFFYMEQIIASAIVIFLLDILVLLMMHTFYHINKWAFYLLIPYLLWILFASFLNINIAIIN